MDMRGYQHYQEDAVTTMTQGELLLLLYDGLVKRLKQAGLALEQEQYPAFETALDKSLAILHHLSDTLDRQYPISGDLAKLYEYFCYELSRVRAGRRPAEMDRVTDMISQLRDSFRQAERSAGLPR